MPDELSDLRQLFGVERQLEPRPWGKIAAASLGLHLLLALVFRDAPIFEPRKFREGPVIVVRNATPLYAPVMEPTQKEANKKNLNPDFDVDSLKPRPNVQIPQGAPSTTRPTARVPAPTPLPVEAPKAIAEAPPRVEDQTQARSIAPPQIGVPDSPPPPKATTPDKPKLAFEPIGAGGYSRTPGQGGQVAVPSSSVSEATRDVARNRTAGGIMVGDEGEGVGGFGAGVNLPPSPGRTGSNLELLSDPQGVDFRPYLIRVLAAVRRNWFAVLPESARLGNQRGRVHVQFAIDREGKVPKLVISGPSGSQPLDRAAVAGISASNPFPPLPAEFKGQQIRLQFTFSYNMQPR